MKRATLYMHLMSIEYWYNYTNLVGEGLSVLINLLFVDTNLNT